MSDVYARAALFLRQLLLHNKKRPKHQFPKYCHWLLRHDVCLPQVVSLNPVLYLELGGIPVYGNNLTITKYRRMPEFALVVQVTDFRFGDGTCSLHVEDIHGPFKDSLGNILLTTAVVIIRKSRVQCSPSFTTSVEALVGGILLTTSVVVFRKSLVACLKARNIYSHFLLLSSHNEAGNIYLWCRKVR